MTSNVRLFFRCLALLTLSVRNLVKKRHINLIFSVSVLVVNDIVNFTQIQQNTLSVSRGAFVLQDLIDDIKVLFEKSMAKEGISFKTDFTAIGNSAFGDGKRMLLLGDDAKIRKILINLLSNVWLQPISETLVMTFIIGFQVHTIRRSQTSSSDTETPPSLTGSAL